MNNLGDRLTVILIWFLSIMVSIISIVQTRGKDWYTPITNKQKMVMTIINASVLFMVIVFMYDALFIDFSKTLIISLVTLIILLFFISPPIFSKVRFLFGQKNQPLDLDTDMDKPMDSINPLAEEKSTLKEYLQKFITVFNCTFFVLNTCYIFYIMQTGKNSMPYSAIVLEENSQIVSITVLFWLTLVGTILTSKDWNYTDVVKKAETKKIKKDANYYIRKIISINR